MAYRRVIIKEFGPPGVLQVIDEPQLPEPNPGEVRLERCKPARAFWCMEQVGLWDLLS